ncbi:putative quinol monooxygenase [Providencia rettgeri]|uniref:putative quinol monooxygenase n=1 Tax=Providencia TaxID=586 RepID=UPI0022745CDE|nr:MULTISPECIES: hypothetical protein [unclassified Providencia]MDB9565272.1 hypothetical protein [Providencia rettgeri]WOB89763.1 hypothetical protein P3L44_13690 [Providencia sp. PROV175]
MPEIRIVATVIAKDNEVEFVKAATKSIVEPSNRDEGCLQYELHQDVALIMILLANKVIEKVFIIITKIGIKI